MVSTSNPDRKWNENSRWTPISGRAAPILVVLDDFFPHPGSAFRFEEFRCYLDHIPNSAIYSTGGALHLADEARPVADLIASYEASHPTHAGRLFSIEASALPPATLYYAVFLHVIYGFIEAIERQAKPFAFTLYPGGGFALDDDRSDAMMRRVFDSPCFERVIATQPVTRDYLLAKAFCREDQVLPLYGGVLTRSALPPPPVHTRYGAGKSTLDLCFVANRYSAHGADKGYDLFVAMAKSLGESPIDARFHVVGRFDATILDLGAAAPLFSFYGPRPTSFFRSFYAGIDAIVSPTRPFVLGPGRFDGFPTGCSVEAGLHEVAVICTDKLGLNVDFEDGEDLLLVEADVKDIVAKVEALASQPGRLEALGRNARRRMLEVYGYQRQMQPRIDLLIALLEGATGR